MAVCEIWDVRGRLDHPIDYAENPEKTANPKYTEDDLQAMVDVMEYATNKDKTEQRFFVTGVNCDPTTARDEMMITKAGWSDTSEIVCYHGFQSFKHGEVTPEQAHEVGVKLAERMWGDRFQVIVATHLNTDCLHNHFVVCSTNMWTGKKFDCNEGAYWKFRALSDELCAEHNLTVIKNPTGKTPRSIYFAEKNGEPTTFNVLREAIDYGIEHSRSFEYFKWIMKDMGYIMCLNPKHRYWTIRSANSKKSVRMYRLGDEYNNEAIRRRIHENNTQHWRNAAEYEHSRKQMKRFKPRVFVFRGSFKKLKSFGGLYAKYLHYLYLMGKLPKRNQRKPLSPEMREAWRHLDRYSRQVTLVSNKKLHTLDDVKAFITDTDKEIKEVTELREKVYNKLRYCDDDDRIRELKKSRDDCTTLLRQLRKEKKIALTIIEDEPKINENIRCEIQAQNLARGRKPKERKKVYER